MAVISISSFSGEIPNLPAYLLPAENAQVSQWNDFAQKDLRPLKQGVALNTVAWPSPIKGIYSETGTTAFTWTTETYAYKSPVINEQYNRVYFLNSGGFQVADGSTASSSGGPPAVSYLAGVPQPTAQVLLEVKDRTSLPDYPNAVITTSAWWDYQGTQTGRVDNVAISVVKPWREYTFPTPAKVAWVAGTTTTTTTTAATESSEAVTSSTTTGGPSSGTHPDATLVVQIIAKDASVSPAQEFFNITVAAGATNPTSSLAFPGGVETSLVAGATTSTLYYTWGVMETRAYCYTLVNTYGEESAPSPANSINVTYVQYVQVSGAYPSIAGYRPLSAVRIYRTFGTSTDYYSVNYTSVSSTVGLDYTWKSTDVGTALTSQEFYTPTAGMQGLVALPNGVFAAFKGSVLYFSEPFRPHAWPYSMSFPQNIRGICVTGQSLVVSTTAGIYLVLGSNPANMAQQRMPIPQAAVDHKLMYNIEGAVAFASQDGLVTVQGTLASLNMSQKLFSREDWRSRYSSILASPSTARMAYHDGFLVMVDSASPLGFIIRLDEATGTYTQFNEQFDAMFYLPVTDTLYYSKGGYIYSFRTDGYYTFTWKSKDFVMPKYTTFGAFYIRASGNVTVTIFADGEQYTTFTTSGTGYYRLPSSGTTASGATTPGSALRWSIQLQSNNLVQYVAMASDMSELKDA